MVRKQEKQCQAEGVYIFVGPPGSGKGTLSDLCARELGWCQLSTGNVCRHHIAEQTEIGRQIDFAIKSGKLISDSLIVAMVSDWFDHYLNQAHAVILDGFPRTVPQAKELAEILKSKYAGLKEHVIQLCIPDEEIVQRLCNRFICENKQCQAVYSLAAGSGLAPSKLGVCDTCSHRLIRRKDDNQETVCERLAGYHRHEQALLDYYDSTGIAVQPLSVNKPLCDVFNDFKYVLGLETT